MCRNIGWKPCYRADWYDSTQVHIIIYLIVVYLLLHVDAGVETQDINELENEDMTNHQSSNEMPDKPQSGLICHHH